MKHCFKAEQWLPYPVEGVFAFFANPVHLPPLMPAWQDARIEEAVLKSPGAAPASTSGSQYRSSAAGTGTTMILSFRAIPRLPIRLNWHARITEFAWNDHFCDEQDRGPFAYWRHCHRVFSEVRDGVSGTLVRDELEYAFPGGPLGDIANALAGRAQIESIFKYRQEQTCKLMPKFLQMTGR
ncbi:SRPBCC family protein [Terriglobus saanensis]|uniref:Cyclase/dehydrase n=1 Tax=Terriglobus saanensis (strain ATCC BAA-1853 / DSM 23119 / SP1PR4) TaxID=401053 RepID=E8UXN6_TERSS|nr:SRPBCC family protein [Terriglobus saanensis]ADV81980.1 cyclase/dehydrase [Terriglobus saanensis SP1PR4]